MSRQLHDDQQAGERFKGFVAECSQQALMWTIQDQDERSDTPFKGVEFLTDFPPMTKHIMRLQVKLTPIEQETQGNDSVDVLIVHHPDKLDIFDHYPKLPDIIDHYQDSPNLYSYAVNQILDRMEVLRTDGIMIPAGQRRVAFS